MQPLARNTVGLARRGVCLLQKRASSGQTFISGPPQNRVSFAEKFILGGTMCVSLLVVPSWVLVNLKNYQGGD